MKIAERYEIVDQPSERRDLRHGRVRGGQKRPYFVMPLLPSQTLERVDPGVQPPADRGSRLRRHAADVLHNEPIAMFDPARAAGSRTIRRSLSTRSLTNHALRSMRAIRPNIARSTRCANGIRLSAKFRRSASQ